MERASDIHIEPKEKELQVRMRIDGVLRKILTIPKNLQNSVISRYENHEWNGYCRTPCSTGWTIQC